MVEKCTCGKEIYGAIGIALLPENGIFDMKTRYACVDCMTEAWTPKPEFRYFFVFFDGYTDGRKFSSNMMFKSKGFIKRDIIMKELEDHCVTNAQVTNIMEMKEKDYLDYTEKIDLEYS